MHKLERGEAPKCLDKFKHGQNNWDDVSWQDKEEIWLELEAMQGHYCAYCEASLVGNKKHIEHFRQRDRYPQGTFVWTNLFGSCNCEDRCGKYKDKCGTYPPEDLIKPDDEDPEVYFIFGSRGTIEPRHGLSATDRRRAEETLRIFNLKHGPLRHQRELEIKSNLQTVEEICELSKEYPLEDLLPLWEAELARIKSLPFTTAIKHALTSQMESIL